MKDDHPQATGDHHPARLSTVDELMTFGIDLLTAVGASPADQAGRQPGNGAQRHGVHVNWTVDQPWAGGAQGCWPICCSGLVIVFRQFIFTSLFIDHEPAEK